MDTVTSGKADEHRQLLSFLSLSGTSKLLAQLLPGKQRKALGHCHTGEEQRPVSTAWVLVSCLRRDKPSHPLNPQSCKMEIAESYRD